MTTSKAIAQVHPPEDMTPMTILGRAVESGASVETLEKLMGLQERWETNGARRAYNDAIAQARAEIPVIFKANEKTGMGGSYKYEDLGSIARIIDPILSKHGLSYRFKSESNGEVRITCVITHRDGHSEENSLTAKSDTTGSKNAVQALGSTVTYLQRYTLKLALGIATSKDDDGDEGGAPIKKSSAQAKRDGDWQEYEGQFAACNSLEELRELRDAIKSDRTIPKAWHDPLNDLGLRRLDQLKATHPLSNTSQFKKQLTESLKLTAEETQVIDHDPVTGEIIGAPQTDPDAYLDDLDSQMSVCKTDADLDEVWKEHVALEDTLFPPDRDKAQFLFEKHEARIKASMAVDACFSHPRSVYRAEQIAEIVDQRDCGADANPPRKKK